MFSGWPGVSPKRPKGSCKRNTHVMLSRCSMLCVLFKGEGMRCRRCAEGAWPKATEQASTRFHAQRGHQCKHEEARAADVSVFRLYTQLPLCDLLMPIARALRSARGAMARTDKRALLQPKVRSGHGPYGPPTTCVGREAAHVCIMPNRPETRIASAAQCADDAPKAPGRHAPSDRRVAMQGQACNGAAHPSYRIMALSWGAVPAPQTRHRHPHVPMGMPSMFKSVGYRPCPPMQHTGMLTTSRAMFSTSLILQS